MKRGKEAWMVFLVVFLKHRWCAWELNPGARVCRMEDESTELWQFAARLGLCRWLCLNWFLHERPFVCTNLLISPLCENYLSKYLRLGIRSSRGGEEGGFRTGKIDEK